MCALFKLLAFYLKRRDITFRLHDTDVRCWGMQAQWELKLAQRLAEERPYRGQGVPRRNVNAIPDMCYEIPEGAGEGKSGRPCVALSPL